VVLVNPDLAADKALRYLFGRLLRALLIKVNATLNQGGQEDYDSN
jgi:hypothetical protein